MLAVNGISVIICTFNAYNRIIPTLEAIVNQSIDKNTNCEVLVIDNASNDETAMIVDKFWRQTNSHIPLRIISEPKPGKANALLTGYNEAKYELMLLCDDDNWLHPDYFKIVIGIFEKYPEIALAGGYGIAEFRTDEKPLWFDKWQNNYVCGKHLDKSGFLEINDFRIWGAGSILRKSMWKHILESGFQFVNSTKAGKSLGEDTEIAYAVMYSGGKLFFDERLWFFHDLSGGRISWKNFLEQMKVNGKISACFTIFNIAYKSDNISKKMYYFQLYILLIRHFLGFVFQCLIPNNKAMRITRFAFLKELFLNHKQNYSLLLSSHKWINKIKLS